MIKIVQRDVLVLLQVIVDLGLPSPNEGSIDLGVVVSCLHPLVVEVFGTREDESIESSVLSHFNLTLVGAALALMYPAHVPSKALAVFEHLPALGTLVRLFRGKLVRNRMVLLGPLLQAVYLVSHRLLIKILGNKFFDFFPNSLFSILR